jgi:hypothetical protein
MSDTWVSIVDILDKVNTANAGPYYIDTEAFERAQSTITFQTGNPSTEMLKVGKDGFWVRGVKVDQDDKEAEKVYNAFRAWMVWSELNRK